VKSSAWKKKRRNSFILTLLIRKGLQILQSFSFFLQSPGEHETQNCQNNPQMEEQVAAADPTHGKYLQSEVGDDE
jgi:hypothetical protein